MLPSWKASDVGIDVAFGLASMIPSRSSWRGMYVELVPSDDAATVGVAAWEEVGLGL